jgi:hypothetical protein
MKGKEIISSLRIIFLPPNFFAKKRACSKEYEYDGNQKDVGIDKANANRLIDR